ncbi:response regulator transcription factor [Cyanobium sp. FGCU-52]|nr:response regulator transcription factor [Cyanobium sp. FGCU52]
MAPVPLRCLFVEDHGMFAELVGGLLRSSCDLEIVELARTAAEGMAAIDRHRPGLLILDLDLPDGSGVAVAEHLQATVPHGRVLVLSAQAAQFVCPEGLQPIVIAVVDKTQAMDVLLIQVAAYVENVVGTPPPTVFTFEKLSGLTGREREVLGRLGLGEATKAIAHHLDLSVSTVESHRRNIAAKLGVSGAELIRLAVLHNLSTPPTAGGAGLPPA